jgi:hypothetical protein
MKRFKWLRIAAALMVLCATGNARVAGASYGIYTFLVGDTLSLTSGAAHDSLTKHPFDCCSFFFSSGADTTRPLFVYGANYATFKLSASDTNTALRVHLTGAQVSNDSTNWTAVNIGGTANNEFIVSIDTTLVSLAVTWTASGTVGWARELRMYPQADYDGTIQPRNASAAPEQFLFKWVRLIFTQSHPTLPAGGSGHHGFRVRAFVWRDDRAKEMLEFKDFR